MDTKTTLTAVIDSDGHFLKAIDAGGHAADIRIVTIDDWMRYKKRNPLPPDVHGGNFKRDLDTGTYVSASLPRRGRGETEMSNIDELTLEDIDSSQDLMREGVWGDADLNYDSLDDEEMEDDECDRRIRDEMDTLESSNGQGYFMGDSELLHSETYAPVRRRSREQIFGSRRRNRRASGPNVKLRRPWYRSMRVNRFNMMIPYVPKYLLFYQKQLFPSTYVHVHPNMSETENLPTLDHYGTINNMNPQEIVALANRIREENRCFVTKGYDPVPNFHKGHFMWARCIDTL